MLISVSGVVGVIWILLPGNGEVNCLTSLTSGVERWKSEIGQQLSPRLVFGARQMEWPNSTTIPQHRLDFASQ
jgi:hypothetical protein